MTGVVDQRRLGVGDGAGKLGQLGPHLEEAEIVAVDDLEADAAQGGRDAPRVDGGVFERRGEPVGAVPDDERHAALGCGCPGGCRRADRGQAQHKGEPE